MSNDVAPTSSEAPSAAEYLVRTGGAVVIVAAALLASVAGAFLVPLKVSGSYLPVAAVITVAANIGLPLLALWWVRSRLVALIPGLIWFIVVLLATQPDSSGGVVIANMWPATVYLLSGAAAIAVMGYLTIVGSLRRFIAE
ncbi:hypothetical protein FB566_3927 [Stackebrandtia endophytica]|uniref:Uncharacterized protein n=1 Tax=Stackebrandtia endophytica TaxID=1496996 RepID=A0A543B0J4_9ACTN|nr:hypothetical protein [Stackebrandtia endophytica]TQL78344.1 hypothetical protein FB566_3927 [Stackebrandtia endophytica]